YLLGNHPQLLPREDRAAAERVERAFHKDGIQLVLGCEVQRVEQRGPEKVLHAACGEGVREIVVDDILVGVGRVPNVDGLNLEAANVRYDVKEGVHVDDRLRTSNPRIYAAGDIC